MLFFWGGSSFVDEKILGWNHAVTFPPFILEIVQKYQLLNKDLQIVV